MGKVGKRNDNDDVDSENLWKQTTIIITAKYICCFFLPTIVVKVINPKTIDVAIIPAISPGFIDCVNVSLIITKVSFSRLLLLL